MIMIAAWILALAACGQPSSDEGFACDATCDQQLDACTGEAEFCDQEHVECLDSCVTAEPKAVLFKAHYDL